MEGPNEWTGFGFYATKNQGVINFSACLQIVPFAPVAIRRYFIFVFNHSIWVSYSLFLIKRLDLKVWKLFDGGHLVDFFSVIAKCLLAVLPFLQLRDIALPKIMDLLEYDFFNNRSWSEK